MSRVDMASGRGCPSSSAIRMGHRVSPIIHSPLVTNCSKRFYELLYGGVAFSICVDVLPETTGKLVVACEHTDLCSIACRSNDVSMSQ